MRKILVAAFAVCMAGSSTAFADVVTIEQGGVIIASWIQSLDPTPISYDVTAGYTQIPIYDSFGLDGATSIYWYTPPAYGGLSSYYANINIIDFVNAQSQPPFSGPVSAPIFMDGVYTGTEVYNSGMGDVPATYTISVPEPATWALTLVGLGMIGLATRGRRKIGVTFGGLSD